MALSISNELFSVDEEIIHQDARLRIKRRVGEGFTAVVYEADWQREDEKLTVAVKAMKPLDIPKAREKFEEEARALSLLMVEEKTANQQLRTDFKIAPTYFGKGTHKGVDYIVMEFIRGVELPDRLMQNPNGRMEEKDALLAGWQFFLTLDILHKKLKKNFIDLKFENLWWVENQDGEGQLKMTDFGTLADIKEGGLGSTSRDLLLGSIILFRLLTGYALDYNIYGLKERAELILKQYDYLSWGTKRILRRALHRVPERRYTEAMQIATDLRQLVDFWRSNDDTLYQIATSNLEEGYKVPDAGSDAARRYAQNAMAALSIIETRTPEYRPTDIQNAKEKARGLLEKGGFFQTGHALFMGGSWQDAYKKFLEGRDESDNPGRYRRWAYLAQAMINHTIPDEQFEETRQEAIRAIDEWSEKGDWPAALETWGRLRSRLNPKGVEALINDCNLFQALEAGEKSQAEDKYKEAGEAFRQALQALEALPDGDFVRENETGDLRARAQEMEYAAGQYGRANELLGGIRTMLPEGQAELSKEQVEQALSKFQEAIKIYPEHPSLRDVLRRAIHASLRAGEFRTALSFFYAARQMPALIEGLQEEYGILLALWKVDRVVQAGRRTEALRECKQILFSTENALAALAAPALRNYLTRIEQESFNAEEIENLQTLREIFEKFPKDNLSGAREKISEEIRSLEEKDGQRAVEYPRKAEELVQKAQQEFIISGNQVFDISMGADWVSLIEEKRRERKAGLEKALEWLDEAEKLAQSSGQSADILSRIQNLRKQIEERLKQADEQFPSADKEAARRRVIEHWKQLNSGGPLSSQEMSHLDWDTLFTAFSEARRYLLYHDAHDVEIGAIFQVVSHDLSRRFTDTARQKMANLPEAVRQLLSKGDREIARGVINTWSPISRDLPQVKAFLDWEAENQEVLKGANRDENILRDIRRFSGIHGGVDISRISNENILRDIRQFSEQPILTDYWQGSPSLQYLKSLREFSKQAAIDNAGKPDSRALLENVRSLIESDQLLRRIEGANSSVNDWGDTKTLLVQIAQAVIEKDAKKLDEIVRGLPLVNNLEAALATINRENWEVITGKHSPRSDNPWPEGFVLRKWMYLTVGLVGIIVLALGILIGYFIAMPKPLAVAGKPSPTPTWTATLTPSVTPVPTLTPAPTVTPIPTVMPTDTSIPTPIPTSTYQVTDATGIYPAIPAYAERAWLLNDDAVTAASPLSEKPSWQSGASADKDSKSEPYFYTTQGNVSITWQFDQPFPESGVYQVFVLDTLKNSNTPVTYTVFLNDQQVSPDRGVSPVIYSDAQRTYKYISLSGHQFDRDAWLSLGFYRIQAGQTLRVQTNIPALDPKTQTFALDRLLVIKLDEPSIALYESLSALPLYGFVDDSAAISWGVLIEGECVPAKKIQDTWQASSEVPAWGGNFRYYNQSDDKHICATLPLAGKVPPGAYRLWAWIPAAHASAQVEYALLGEREVLKTNDAHDAYLISQADQTGAWVQVGEWAVTEEQTLIIRVSIPVNTTGETAIDAFALVKTD